MGFALLNPSYGLTLQVHLLPLSLATELSEYTGSPGIQDTEIIRSHGRLVPAIHACLRQSERKAWMPATSAGMTSQATNAEYPEHPPHGQDPHRGPRQDLCVEGRAGHGA